MWYIGLPINFIHLEALCAPFPFYWEKYICGFKYQKSSKNIFNISEHIHFLPVSEPLFWLPDCFLSDA